MTLEAFLFSYTSVIGVAMIVVGIPFLLVYPRFFGIPRGYGLLAVMGTYVTLFYLKPAVVPLWVLPPVVIGLAMLTRAGLKGGREPVTQCLAEPMVWGILTYAFLLFFFRWEPPGSEPTRWGAIARILFETQVIPGEPTSSTSIRDLRGVSLGLPLMLALNFLLRWAPLERIISFYECFSLATFAFCLASALTPWFSRRAGLVASLIALGIFTYPQQSLAWGGTTMLLGMTGGFCLLEVTKTLLIRKIARREVVLFALVFVFAAHSHLIGFCVSLAVCLPVAALMVLESNRRRIALGGLASWVALSLLLFLPFFLRWRLAAAPDDFKDLRLWQERMAPHLFAPVNGLFGGGFLQARSYLWEPAALASLFALVTAVWFDGRCRFLSAFLLSAAVSSVLLLNARLWWLPFSFLFSPEAVGTFLVFPLSLPLGWIADRWEEARASTVKHAFGACLIVGIALGGWQFSTRVYPLLFRSRLTVSDREAMKLVEEAVPWEECIEVKGGEAGMWIPVLALRCTVVASESERETASKTNWVFIADQEKGLPMMGGELVFDNGARLVKRK